MRSRTPGALADITDDDRYSKGALAAADGQATRTLMPAIPPGMDGRPPV